MAQVREEHRLEQIMVDKIRRGDRLHWEDIPDGPRVKGTFEEVVFARGEIRYAPR